MRRSDIAIEGLSYIPDVLSVDEESHLLSWSGGLEFRSITMRGVTARRRVVCFGYDYQYTARAIEEADPLPEALASLLPRLAARAGVADRFNQVIVSNYPRGAGIGWHTDAPVFGDTILAVSLGGPALLQLRPRGEGAMPLSRVVLERRSLYALEGRARWEYQHCVLPVRAQRVSLTFREVLG